jgi:hypothetical protein
MSAPPIGGSRICSSCSYTNFGRHAECLKCGTPLPPFDLERQGAFTWIGGDGSSHAVAGFCTTCGNQLLASDRFCRSCGTPVAHPQACLACGNPLLQADRFCRSCGSPVA